MVTVTVLFFDEATSALDTYTEADLMREIKRALDPGGLLNPGKIFD